MNNKLEQIEDYVKTKHKLVCYSILKKYPLLSGEQVEDMAQNFYLHLIINKHPEDITFTHWTNSILRYFLRYNKNRLQFREWKTHTVRTHPIEDTDGGVIEVQIDGESESTDTHDFNHYKQSVLEVIKTLHLRAKPNTYFLDAISGLSLSEIALKHGVTRQAIRQSIDITMHSVNKKLRLLGLAKNLPLSISEISGYGNDKA